MESTLDGDLEAYVGLKARFSKTVGEADVYLFAGLTGDLDPNHVDEEYCKLTSFGHRVAHGALLVGYMSAASSQALTSIVRPNLSLGYDRVRFLKPVYFGDTITVDYEITDADSARRRTTATVEVHNQAGELVAVATHILKFVD